MGVTPKRVLHITHFPEVGIHTVIGSERKIERSRPELFSRVADNEAEDEAMESVIRKMPIPFALPAVESHRPVRRSITPQAGRALEKLGHAIEYLTDAMVERKDPVAPNTPDMQAVQLLMALNRSIYNECPARASLGDRIRDFLCKIIG